MRLAVPRISRRRMSWGVLSGVVACGTLAALWPAESQLADLRAQTTTDLRKLAADRALIRHHGEIDALVERTQSSLHTASDERNPAPLGSLLIEMTQLAAQDGVTLLEVTPEAAPTPAETLFVSQAVQIRQRGTFAATERFIARLSLGRSLVRVERVALATAPRTGPPSPTGAPELESVVTISLEHLAPPALPALERQHQP